MSEWEIGKYAKGVTEPTDVEQAKASERCPTCFADAGTHERRCYLLRITKDVDRLAADRRLGWRRGRQALAADIRALLTSHDRLTRFESEWNQPLPKSKWEETQETIAHLTREIERLRAWVKRRRTYDTPAGTVNADELLAVMGPGDVARVARECLDKDGFEGHAETLAKQARLGWELSTYAASIHWDRRKNTPEWMDGLRERIESLQALGEPSKDCFEAKGEGSKA